MVVVMVLKVCESGLQFVSSVEYFKGKELISELAKEAFDVAVLPRFARLYIAVCNTLGKSHCPELGTI